MCLTHIRSSSIEKPMGEEWDDFNESDDENDNNDDYYDGSDFDMEAQQMSDPDILTMSWRSCPANGGLELFLIGKNFARDSKVVFYECEGVNVTWRADAIPVSDYLHQCHLVCVVPPYLRTDIVQPVQVRVVVECNNGKKTEPQPFAYTPVVGFLPTSPHSRAFPEPTDVLDIFLLEVRCKSEDLEYGEGVHHPVLLWTTQSEDSQTSSMLEITEPRPGCSTSTTQHSMSRIPPIPLYVDRTKFTLPMQLLKLFEIKRESDRAKEKMAFLRSQLIGASSSPERPTPGESYQMIPELDHSAAIQAHATPSTSTSGIGLQEEDSSAMEHNKPRKMRKMKESKKTVAPSTSMPDLKHVLNPPTTVEQARRSLDNFANLAARFQSHSSPSSHITTPCTSPEKYALRSPDRKRKIPSPSDVVEKREPHFAQRIADLLYPFDDEPASDSFAVSTPRRQIHDPVQNHPTMQATQQIDYSTMQATQHFDYSNTQTMQQMDYSTMQATQYIDYSSMQAIQNFDYSTMQTTQPIDYFHYPGDGTYRIYSLPTTPPSLSSPSSVIHSPHASPIKSPVQSSPHILPANPFSPDYTSHQSSGGTKSPISSPDSISKPMSSMNLSTMPRATSTTQELHLSPPLQNDPNTREMEESMETAEAGYSVSIASALEIAEGGAAGEYTLPTDSSLIPGQFPRTSHVAIDIPPTPMSTDPNTSFPQQIQVGIEEKTQDLRAATSPLQQQYMQEVHTETSEFNECNIDYITTFESELPDLSGELDDVLGPEGGEESGAEYSMGGLPASEIATRGSTDDTTLPMPSLIQNTINQSSMTPYSIGQHSSQDFPMSTSMDTQVPQSSINRNKQLVKRSMSMEPGTTFSLLTYQNKPGEDQSMQSEEDSNQPTEIIHSSSTVHPELPLQSPFPETREDLDREYLDELMHMENREATEAGYSIGIHSAPEIAVSGPIGFSILPTSSSMPSRVGHLHNVMPFPHSSQAGPSGIYMPAQIPPRPMSTGLQTPVPSVYPSQNEPDDRSTETGNFQRSSSMPKPDNNQTEN